MPTPDEITKEQEKLYESASLRDDLNDAEGTALLQWGQTQVTQMAQTFPDDFEKKTRFLRQLLKNINRFVGQREFNDMDGQRKYMVKVVKYLEPLGYTADEKNLFAALPDDPKDMMANLKAILTTLTPKIAKASPETPGEPAPSDDVETQAADDNPLPTYSPNIEKTEVIPDIRDIVGYDSEAQSTYSPNIDKTEVIPDIRDIVGYDSETKTAHSPNTDTTEVIPDIKGIVDAVETNRNDSILENPNTHSINQATTEDDTEESSIHDEKEE